MAADSFLLEVAVGRMTFPDVFEAFLLSRKYRIRGLHDRYAQELAKRVTPATFCQVLQAAVGYTALSAPGASLSTSLAARHAVYDPAASPLHLALCTHCLQYLVASHLDRLVGARKAQEATEVARLVHHLLSHLYLS